MQYWVVLSFASVMIAPVLYYICIVFWLPRTMLERAQYLAGISIYVTLGPFLNILVLVYALWNMDNFGWGKTRQIVESKEAGRVLDEKNGDVLDEKRFGGGGCMSWCVRVVQRVGWWLDVVVW